MPFPTNPTSGLVMNHQVSASFNNHLVTGAAQRFLKRLFGFGETLLTSPGGLALSSMGAIEERR